MALLNKRIIDLPERSALNSDDYTVVDGSNGGTSKYKLSQLQDDVGEAKQGVTQLSQTVTTQGQQIAQNTEDITDLKEDLNNHSSWYVIPEDFGAIGDGITDDSAALQECIDDAYAKNAIVYLSKVYATSKPIKVYGRVGIVTEQNTTYICGTGRGDCGIKKISANVLTGSYTGNAVLVLVNASGIGSDTFNGNASGVRLEDFRVDANNVADYGIDMPYSTASCMFRRLFINKALAAGIHAGHDNYLNLYEQIAIYNSTDYAFQIDGGINTSDNFLNCYVSNAQVAYKIRGVYMQMTNCCADNINDTVFDLNRFNGALTAPGSEAYMAKSMFKVGPASRVLVLNPYTYGNYDDADAVHCVVEAGGVLNIKGGSILIDRTATNKVAPGKLFETAYTGEFYLDDTKTGKFATNNAYISASAYGKTSGTYGNVNTRNGNTLAFLGMTGYKTSGHGDYDADEPKLDTSAIYMGFAETPLKLLNGQSMGATVFNGGGTMAGDILLSKMPEMIGGMGWIAAQDSPTSWSSNKYLKIPILQYGGSADYPTIVSDGQRFFDTDKGFPMVYVEKEWQPDTFGLQRFNVQKTNGTMTIRRAAGVITFALITIMNSTSSIMALAYFYNSGLKIVEIVGTGITGTIDPNDNTVNNFTFATSSRFVSVVTLFGRIESVT